MNVVHFKIEPSDVHVSYAGLARRRHVSLDLRTPLPTRHRGFVWCGVRIFVLTRLSCEDDLKYVAGRHIRLGLL